MRILTLSLITIGLVTLASTLAEAAPRAKVNPFSPLTGSYAVGTTEYHLVDQSRSEPYSSSPRLRHVSVQVWYPASADASAAKAPWVLSPKEFLGDTKDAKDVNLYNGHVETRSYLNAPVAAGGPFPVLLFNPGGGNSRFTSSFICEQLASQGYVVFAVEHIGDSMGTHYPDGTPLALDKAVSWADPEFDEKVAKGEASADLIVEKTVASWATREERIFTVVVDDSRFVLDQIAAQNNQSSGSRFSGRLDLDRIGALGWSQGGAASVFLLVNDSRVKATVDLDGQFMGPGKEAFRTNKPVMLLHSQNDHENDPNMAAAMVRLSAMVHSWDQGLLRASTGPRYLAEIEGTDHGSYSDWRLFINYLKPELRQHAKVREQLITELTVSFFQKHLKGEPAMIPMDNPLVINAQMSGASGVSRDK